MMLEKQMTYNTGSFRTLGQQGKPPRTYKGKKFSFGFARMSPWARLRCAGSVLLGFSFLSSAVPCSSLLFCWCHHMDNVPKCSSGLVPARFWCKANNGGKS